MIKWSTAFMLLVVMSWLVFTLFTEPLSYMMAQPIECTAVDMESLRYNNSYLQKVTMFPQCKFSASFYILATGSHGLGLVYSGLGTASLSCSLLSRHAYWRNGRPFLKRRESIARKNLELCFHSILRKNARRWLPKTFVHSAGAGRNRHGVVLARQSRT